MAFENWDSFYITYLPNKFWGIGSILVPNRAPIVDLKHANFTNRGFHTINDIFKNHKDIENLEIYWSEQNITGEIKLPGEWNYCYLNGLGYHLIKTSSDGILFNGENQEEYFYYQLLYDDWVNDFLKDSIYVKGTISKTGDINLVKKNINLTTPLISNLNDRVDFDCLKTHEDVNFKVKMPFSKFYENNQIIYVSLEAIKWINDRLSSFNYAYERPRNDAFELPFIIGPIKLGNWKVAMVENIKEMINEGIAVYDTNRTNINYAVLSERYGIDDEDGIRGAYSITTGSGVKQISQTLNPTLHINEIDLSKLTDVVELDLSYNEYSLLTDIDGSGHKINGLYTWKNIVDHIYEKIQNKNQLRKNGETIKKQLALSIINFYPSVGINTLSAKVTGASNEEKGIYEHVTIKQKQRPNWIYTKNNTIDSSQWWYEYFKPMEYIWKNSGYKNGFLLREKTYNSDEITGLLIWINDIKENLDDFKKHIKSNPFRIDKKYKNFFHSADVLQWKNRVRFFISHDLYKFEHVSGGVKKELDLWKWRSHEYVPIDQRNEWYRTIALMPDYQNDGFTLGQLEYEQLLLNNTTIEIQNKPIKVLPITRGIEILQQNITKNITAKTYPDENLLNLSVWDAIPQSIRMGQFVYRMLKPTSDSDSRNYRLRYATYYKPKGGYWEDNDYLAYMNYKLVNDVTKVMHPVKFTIPTNADLQFIHNLKTKYQSIPRSNLMWFNGLEQKGFNGANDNMTLYQLNTDSFTLEVGNRFNTINRNKKKTDYEKSFLSVWFSPKPRESATIEEKKLLIELTEEIYEVFFATAWTKDMTYKTAAIPGSLYRIRRKDNYYFALPYWKPYKGKWYTFIIEFTGEGLTYWLSKGSPSEAHKKTINVPNGDLCFQWWNENYDSLNSEYAKLVQVSAMSPNANERKENVFYRVLPSNQYLVPNDGTNTADIIDPGALLLFSGIYVIGDYVPENPNNNKQITDIISYIRQHKDSISWNLRIKNEKGLIAKWRNSYKKLMDNYKNIQSIKNMSLNVTTNRIFNPKAFDYVSLLNPDISSILNETIPHFIWKTLNPNQPDTVLHNMKEINWDTEENLITELNNLLKKMFIDSIKALLNSAHILDLKGTDFMAYMKLQDNNKWGCELLIKNNKNVLTKKGKRKLLFANNKPFDDINSIINSNNEINVYGTTIPIKDRFFLTENNIDLNFSIEPLEDHYQAASVWHAVSIESDFTTIKTQIEVLKKQTNIHEINMVQRQQIIQQVQANSANRYYEKTNYELDKSKFFIDWNRETKRASWTTWGDVGTSTLSYGVQGALMGAVGGGGVGAAVGSVVSGLVGFGTSLFSKLTSYSFDNQERRDRMNHAIQSFANNDKAMQIKHETARELDRIMLHNLTTANKYAETNNSIVFEAYNKAIGRKNIYLTQYRPKGKLLEHLNLYYDEYGYDLLIRDVITTGISSISNHVKYVNITENLHHNDTIKEMIENRLLTGVRVINWFY